MINTNYGVNVVQRVDEVRDELARLRNQVKDLKYIQRALDSETAHFVISVYFEGDEPKQLDAGIMSDLRIDTRKIHGVIQNQINDRAARDIAGQDKLKKLYEEFYNAQNGDVE